MRYRAIADTIREEIARGTYVPGNALPSQSALAERFGTTVSTVRQALRLLQEEGLLVFEHGVGSFVSGLTEDYHEAQLSSFSGALGDTLEPVETRILASRSQVADPVVARWFSRSQGLFAVLERVRLIGTRPVILQRSYVPECYAAVLETYTPEKGLYHELGRHLNQVIALAEETLDAVAMPLEVAEVLSNEPGSPALCSRRISKTLRGESVLFDIAYMTGGAVTVALHRRGRFSEFSYTVGTERAVGREGRCDE
jgi:GntR family transcriptional regulator